ncbi:hypothetical protein [Rhizobium tumorigenes]|uniref:hypothetical protein n=1 Tax=Rhizobium tumorigenes TaxID=2041385 RepID=UPI00241F4534|nr:hypothetical protein [Rhizobium tumorigenes]WFS02743.1 hypothetical protein PR016_09140 [Rhizobium tumorigenes]
MYLDTVKAMDDEFLRACALAGLYLQAFSMLERRIDNLLQQALKADDLQSLVVARNMSFMDKVKSIRALLPVTVYGDLAKKIDGRLRGFGDLAERRNLIAHSVFGPSYKGGLEVLVIKANSSLKLPVLSWSISEMFDMIEGLEKEDDELGQLLDEFKQFAALDLSYLDTPTLPDGNSPLQKLLGLVAKSE